jgi:hypothetical protein
MAELEVDAQDVVRLMLQFCKENGLKDSLKALQQESQVLEIDHLTMFVTEVYLSKFIYRWSSGRSKHR